MSIGTLTSKGQITIPKEIRDQVKLKPGQRVWFDVDTRGRLILTPRNQDINSIIGILKSPHRKPVTVRQMNEAVRQRFAKR